MHDLHLERFGAQGDGPIETFVLRGIKDSPPYLHDGRLLTLEDTVEFFNVVSEFKVESRGEGGSCRLHASTLMSVWRLLICRETARS
jgi:hypothetical protein